ncbi:hypothetical protein [Sphingomonas sp. G-3-2-10]|uniref:hypothetical protein n=1 Tax=Sphingomonas sp. G-3-2-10 TaxID=2728838 RepID=UPI00146A2B89|nr:hypothetical protein [Sphingomonas sp. G-3-2-10]NML06098.1 hypothetical protein [Sphingomonas sp. G-3-2-10]
MKLRLVELLESAAGYWKADRDLLLRIACVFYLLPSFALNLFMPDPADTSALDEAGRQAAMIAYFVDNGPWLVSAIGVQLLGTATLLVMLLSPERPTLRDAIGRALWLWPVVLAGWIFASLLCGIGFFPLILPGFYLAGRTFLTTATIVAERRNPLSGLMQGIAHTRGHGWMLTTTYLAVVMANALAAMLLGDLALAAKSLSPVVAAPVLLLASFVSALAALASALLQVAAYRRLAGSSTGM